jgi:sugar lactone lactonase YvrE
MEVSAIRRASIGCLAAAAALCTSLALAASGSAATVSTVAKGLDNPRGLAFDSDGTLFVAEAGHGGNECVKGGPGGEEEETCVGFTSGVSRLDGSTAHRVADGYASAAGRDGSVALGIDGISVINDWRIFAVEGESQFAVPPAGISKATSEKAKAQLGHLFEFTPGHARTLADVGGFDFKWTGEHKSLVPEQFPDANPYAVLRAADGEWVIDAAANTVDWVSDSGKVKVVAFIPNPEKNGKPVSDAVPTCIAKGPDGALYVGQLTGVGNGPGAASIWRVEPRDGDVSKWATGLTAITGCGFDTDGDFYAVEFSTLGFESFAPETGAVVRVPPHSSKPIPLVEKLSFPNGFAARPHQIFVSNWSIAPAAGSHGATGEVLRITH